ncbi:MAG: hypothetical protein B7Y95_17700 [Rhizobiales bacterium 32-66-11]|jgi:hypothetical protein|nr:MAG: hypothetical protein B7Y95_17700 [Rhizobiales bacterium 32-66-11]
MLRALAPWRCRIDGDDMPQTRLPRAFAPVCVPLLLVAVGSAPAAAQEVSTRVSRTTNADGSASVTAAGALDGWSAAEFGVDLSVAAAPVTVVQPRSDLPWKATDSSGAVAWAKVAMPGVSNLLFWDKGAVDVRLDPLQDKSQLGTSFSREWDLGSHISAQVSDSYAVTVAPTSSGEGWSSDKSLSLNMHETGTRLSLGTSVASDRHTWLPSLSAQQNLIGPLVLTTTVADTGTEINRSITAGFHSTW